MGTIRAAVIAMDFQAPPLHDCLTHPYQMMRMNSLALEGHWDRAITSAIICRPFFRVVG